jgi:hypothetical protein
MSSRNLQSAVKASIPTNNLTAAQPKNGTKKKIGVMTSGGDSPGMNAAVRAVARMAMAKGCEPYAIREGYEGLVQGGDLIKRMSWEDVRGYLSEVFNFLTFLMSREEHLLVPLDVRLSENDLVVWWLLNISLKPASML